MAIVINWLQTKDKLNKQLNHILVGKRFQLNETFLQY